MTLLIASLPLYLLMSAVTFAVYGYDKWVAIRNSELAGRGQRTVWRIPERTLHLLALAFGWPGAFAGQRVWRHKTQKREFAIVTWAALLLHLLLWAAVLWWTGTG